MASCNHRILSTGICEKCEKNISITGRNLGKSGMFQWDGEWFGFGPDDDAAWSGWTVVIDSEDDVIAFAITPAGAIETAIYNLQDAQEIVDMAIEEILGC